MASHLILRYIWLIDLLRREKELTRAEISDRWRNSKLNEEKNNVLPERTFHHYIDAIGELFDIEIKCRKNGGYRYYIDNVEDLERDNLRCWLIDTYATLNQVHTDERLVHRIQYEEIPSGHTFLQPIMRAMHEDHVITIRHRNFIDSQAFLYEVAPYALKIINRRWYLIGRNLYNDKVRIYGLDRISEVTPTEKNFTMPEDFSIEEFFRGCCGILTDEKICRVVIRVDNYARQYVETLPLHSSQREIDHDEESTTYEYYVRPNYNFYHTVLSQLDMIEILSPADVRRTMYEYAKSIMENHKNQP